MRQILAKPGKHAAPTGEGRRGYPTAARPLRRAAAGLALALSLAALPTGAVDWSFKAFGTLAAIGSDTGSVGFRRDIFQDRGATSRWRGDIDSRLGLQVDADISQALHAGVQWVARNHAGDFFEQGLDWAYLRWRPRDDLDLRLGRLGLDAFLLSDYRNVGYAYPWMRPPAEFYSLFAPYHFDGADIAKKFSLGEGYLTLKAYGGHSQIDVVDQGGRTDDESITLFGGNLVYESGNWRGRVGYMQIRLENNSSLLEPLITTLSAPPLQAVWPQARSLIKTLSFEGKALNYGSVGAAYDDGVWLGQAEAAYIGSGIEATPDQTTGYLSLGRHFNRVTAYALFGFAESLNRRVPVPAPLVPDPQLLQLRDSIDDGLNTNGTDEMSISLGGRFDVYENIALKAQWTHFWLGGKGNGVALWLYPTPPLPDQINLWSFGVDFVY